MRSISVKYDIHSYVEEKLCDQYFDEPYAFGIAGPEIMKPLRDKRNTSFVFEYDESTTVNSLICAAKRDVWGNPEFRPVNTDFAFYANGERYYPKYSVNLALLLKKYLDRKMTGEITLSILVSHDAGEVASEYPLRYSVYSHEAGKHNEPHIHVRDIGHKYDASVRISDGKVIAGELPPKLEKMAKKKILSDQAFFFECWNTMTDGLHVDINKHFGLIKY